ncbi:hypothetical protein GGI43DRAFT_106377 [Trichoderma evansii]
MEVAPDIIAQFRDSCLVGARQCAVSGKGRAWCNFPTVGPALQACHIIPQQQYHLYPLYPDIDDNDDHDGAAFSPRRLQQAWQRTWSGGNGILLLSHLRELFHTRLLSIHPETRRIRAFVPYDVICDYHGRTAKLSGTVDLRALRHHYDICCIENMAAASRPSELLQLEMESYEWDGSDYVHKRKRQRVARHVGDTSSSSSGNVQPPPPRGEVMKAI